MRTHFFAAIALAASLTGSAAMAADYAVIVIEKPVKAPVDATWKTISPFCALTQWLGPPCEIAAGNGRDVGSIRKIDGGRITEVMVAKTEHSYTYEFPEPNPTYYHGTLAAVATGANASKIVYTLFWDQESLDTAEKKAADRDSRTKQFTAAVEKMVSMSEAK